jgi:hypothetical protein
LGLLDGFIKGHLGRNDIGYLFNKALGEINSLPSFGF